MTLQQKWIIHATVQDVLLHVSQHLDLLPKAQPVDFGELCHDLLIPVLNHTRVTPCSKKKIILLPTRPLQAVCLFHQAPAGKKGALGLLSRH